MKTTFLDSFSTFDDFLIYFAVALALTIAFKYIYVAITPYDELKLIREGNEAAAWSLSGALLGFILPLAAAIENGVSFYDTVIWGAIALVVQLIAYVLVRLALPDIARAIPEGKVSYGIFLGALSLGVGWLNAACMSF